MKRLFRIDDLLSDLFSELLFPVFGSTLVLQNAGCLAVVMPVIDPLDIPSDAVLLDVTFSRAVVTATKGILELSQIAKIGWTLSIRLYKRGSLRSMCERLFLICDF